MNLKSIFICKFDDASYVIRQKATALMYVALIFAFLFILVAAATGILTLNENIMASMIGYGAAIAVFVLVLGILKAGYYHRAANFMVLAMVAIIMIFIATQVGNFGNFVGVVHFT